MHPNPKRIIPILIIVFLAALGWWYFRGSKVNAQSNELSASGTIEANQVIVSPELGGRVLQVLAQEGDPVQAGQVLVRLEEKLIQAQLEQAMAAVAVAQANYDLVAAGQPEEQRQMAIAAAELEVTQAQQALDDLKETAALAKAQAEQAIAAADKQLDLVTQRLDNLETGAKQADIDAAGAAVTIARDRLDKANEKFAPYKKKPEDNLIRARLQSIQADAQQKYDALVTRLNNLLGTANRFELALAESGKALAQAQLDEARRQYNKVKDGPDPEAQQLAEQRLTLAQARLSAAQAEPTSEQLAVANAHVQSAQAALAVIQAQLDKLLLRAPIDSVVLKRAIEPGEFVAPGQTLFSLADLDNLTITVYVPEDRYGQVNLGQKASLMTDSFPGKSFEATVTQIADQAEFTPRNVQTAEGRRTTVFAVSLAIENPGTQLKPGMPADVKFHP
jgi:multidrug resistance efflux pump